MNDAMKAVSQVRGGFRISEDFRPSAKEMKRIAPFAALQ